MRVQSLGCEVLALLQNKFVEVWQNRRIEADAILDEQNHLYAANLGIVLQILLILYKFDD